MKEGGAVRSHTGLYRTHSHLERDQSDSKKKIKMLPLEPNPIFFFFCF